MYDRTYKLGREDEQLYIRELLQRRLRFSSRLMRRLKVEGGVYLNGEPARFRQKGVSGDVLQVLFPEEASYFEPEKIPLTIAYEDEDLLVVDKQPGLVIHPTKNYQSGTLANALAYRMQQLGQSYKIRFVNRLDRDTSGLVIVAKNAHSQKHIADQMQSSQLRKYYIAIVHGQPPDCEGTIDLPIAKDPGHAARRKVMADGLPSVTNYRVLERFDATDGRVAGYAVLRLELVTGRTHQIRVHLAHRGLPIAGDELYGSLFGYDQKCERIGRQALHACELTFLQPTSGEMLHIASDMPGDMEMCIRGLRSDSVAQP